MTIRTEDWEKRRGSGRNLTAEEIAIVREGWKTGRSAYLTAMELKCSTRAIHKWHRKFGMGQFRRTPIPSRIVDEPRPRPTTPVGVVVGANEVGPTEKHIRAVASDRKFKMAMLDAVKSGEERAVFGVVKDRRPWTFKQIRSLSIHGSIWGSPAASCAEEA